MVYSALRSASPDRHLPACPRCADGDGLTAGIGTLLARLSEVRPPRSRKPYLLKERTA